MKRHGNLWAKITDLNNIKVAHKQARRGKAFYTEVKMVDADIERYALEIQSALLSKTFTTSKYESEIRFDGRKERLIHKLPYYPDRIVQHALLNVIGPIFERSFIRDTFQSIPGRGTSDAMRRVKRLIRSDACPQYALKIDVQKYYPSVDGERLKESVRQKIKCKDTIWLVDNIINSMQGLPIGNYTSQHFGNLFLSDFDWWVKQQIRPDGYFRYCDDILFMGNDKGELRKVKQMAEQYLNDLGLQIKPTWLIYDVRKQGVDFVGFVFKPEKTRLRPSIAASIKKACKEIANKAFRFKSDLSALMAYKGWVKYASAKMLWRKHTGRLARAFPKQLRSAV